MTAGKGALTLLNMNAVAYSSTCAGRSQSAPAEHHRLRHALSFHIQRRAAIFAVAAVLLSAILVGMSFACCKEAAVGWSIINDSGSDMSIEIFIDGDKISSVDVLNDQYEMHNTTSYIDHFNMFSSSDTIVFTVVGTDTDGNTHMAERVLELHDGDNVHVSLTLY